MKAEHLAENKTNIDDGNFTKKVNNYEACKGAENSQNDSYGAITETSEDSEDTGTSREFKECYNCFSRAY